MKARPNSPILRFLALTLTFCLGSTAFASAAQNGTYRGETESGYEVKVKVKANKITLFDSSVYAACGSSSFGIKFVFPPTGRKNAKAKIARNGYFRVVFKGSPNVSFNDDRRTLKGKFTGRKVSGSMKVEGLCSAQASFSAKR